MFLHVCIAYTELESTKSADIALLEENATEMGLLCLFLHNIFYDRYYICHYEACNCNMVFFYNLTCFVGVHRKQSY